jgi:hypothetical protein
MVLDDLVEGASTARQFSDSAATDAEDQELQNRVDYGPQDSPSPGGPDAADHLAGLIEMHDPYFGAPLGGDIQ